MFCYQCEQAAHGKGCDVMGVCGKKPDVAALQDLIIFQLRGISHLAYRGRKENGHHDTEADLHVVEGLFSTVTNVNFDSERLESIIRRGEEIRKRLLKSLPEGVKKEPLPESTNFEPSETLAELVEQGSEQGILAEVVGEDIRSLQQLLLNGLKGMAAYVDHAVILGKTDPHTIGFVHEALSFLNKKDPSMDELLGFCMRCGETNIRAMEVLDAAHTDRFGHPEPTLVQRGTRKGPAIIISGHDLLDLEELLKQTQDTGVQVYTHGEMLPAHGYPGLKKYKHLAGHFGTAWQNQQKEFDSIPAAILFTTNCIQKPRTDYMDRVFTTGLVAFPRVEHIPNRDFSKVIAKAKSLAGFSDTPGDTFMTGFGRNAVLSVADKVVAAVKAGQIKHFFLIGGCDGTKPGRNYYTEFAEKAPADTVILTLACGKFRINHLELGDIGGIPRILDIGQCNDAYSAIKIAQALAGAFGCGVNDLPLSLILSWYEQKAVAILLSLLSLGIKGIRIGPSLPAFLSPNVIKYLVENFGVKPITTAEKDLAEIMAK